MLGIIGLWASSVLGLLAVPILIGTDAFFSGSAGCSGQPTGAAGQPAAQRQGQLDPGQLPDWYKQVGQQYGVPWTVLAGIGTVESDNGQTTLPGVHSGAERLRRGRADADRDRRRGRQQLGRRAGPPGQREGQRRRHRRRRRRDRERLRPRRRDRRRRQVPAGSPACRPTRRRRSSPTTTCSPTCRACCTGRRRTRAALLRGHPRQHAVGQLGGQLRHRRPGRARRPARRTAVATAITYAEQQLGKPYLWGGTGPDAFDCSGLVMMAYRAAGSTSRAPRSSSGPPSACPASQAQPGDLVFFAGADGTPTSPGHVGLVIGNGKMIEAYATGFPVRISSYGHPVVTAATRSSASPAPGRGPEPPPRPLRPRPRRPACPPRAPPSLLLTSPLVDRFDEFLDPDVLLVIYRLPRRVYLTVAVVSRSFVRMQNGAQRLHLAGAVLMVAAALGPACPVQYSLSASGQPTGGAGSLDGPFVALGDSFAAGDLIPVSPSGTPAGCLRSSHDYGADAAAALGAHQLHRRHLHRRDDQEHDGSRSRSCAAPRRRSSVPWRPTTRWSR